MIIVMQANADEQAIAKVVQTIRAQGLMEHVSRGQERVIIGAVGDERVFDAAQIERLPQVQKAIRILHDWRMISRETWAQDTQFVVRGVAFGGGEKQLMTAINSQTPATFRLPENSCSVLLDPFFVLDNPYALSGLAETQRHDETDWAQSLTEQVAQWHAQNVAVAVRVRDGSHIQAALNAAADVLYLGGEVLANRYLLQEIGSLNVPSIVCKAAHHSVRDWLVAAEHIALRGNQQVILGEAGTLRLHDATLRLDVDAIAEAKKLSHLPVLANISQLAHAYMDSETLYQLARAAGADVVVV